MAVSNFTAQVAPMGHVAKVALQEQESAGIKQQAMQQILPDKLSKDSEKVEKPTPGSAGQKVRRRLEERQGRSAGRDLPERVARKAGPAVVEPAAEAEAGGDVWSGNIVNLKV